MAARLKNLDDDPINPMTICVIGAEGFIGSHLCEKLVRETQHQVLALTICYENETYALDHLRDLGSNRIKFRSLRIKEANIEYLNSENIEDLNIEDLNIKEANTEDLNIKEGSTKILSELNECIAQADLVINLASTCADYNRIPRDDLYRDFIDGVLPVARYVNNNKKRLIHFSLADVYGKTLGTFLPRKLPFPYNDVYPHLSPQESFILAEPGLECTLVRPFNWIGLRMDFIPGIDGPIDGVLSYNLILKEPLNLVHGESQRTYLCIDEAIEAVLLMIENPSRSNGRIFEVGNPENQATVKQFSQMMTEVFSEMEGVEAFDLPPLDASSVELYGEPFNEDEVTPDVASLKEQLGWVPKTSIRELLRVTLENEHEHHAGKLKAAKIEGRLAMMRKKREETEKKKAQKAAARRDANMAKKRQASRQAKDEHENNRNKGIGKGATVHVFTGYW